MEKNLLNRRDFVKRLIQSTCLTMPMMFYHTRLMATGNLINRLLQSHVYNGMKELAELPYFEMSAQGRLRLIADGLENGIDGHTHLALSGFAAGDPDLLASYPETIYYLPPDIKSSVNVYINQNNGPEDKKRLSGIIMDSITPGGSEVTDTHTIPNLLAEMDLLKIDKAVILPIRMGLPFGDDQTERFFQAIQDSGKQDRFIICGSVKPTLDDAVTKVDQYKEQGLKGIKMHPNYARFFPDDKKCWPVYEACGIYELPVLIHSGRTGFKEKKTLGFKLYSEDYADISHFEEPIAAFPDTRFVLCHSGAMQNEEAVRIAKTYKNVWLDIHGQGVERIQAMIKELGPERLMYGSDWAFYPEAIMVARLLLATESDKTVRQMIFSDNARRFWKVV